MCLAIPARIVALGENATATVNLGGIRKDISLALVPEARLDDYVIVHVGYALGLIDPEEAERTLAIFSELETLQQDAS